MNVVLWIIAGLLAAALLWSGYGKLSQSKEQLAAGGYAWVEDFGDGAIKGIGVLEILAAAGLVLPGALDIAPVLVPLAAVGEVLLMIGAAITHYRRQESKEIMVNVILLVVAAVVAWGRFGPYSF